MSVTATHLSADGWTGSGEITGGNSFTVQHVAKSDNLDDGPLSVALGALNVGPDRIPNIFAAYQIGNDFDPRVIVTGRSTEPIGLVDDGAGRLWRITTTYGKPGDKEKGDEEDNPLLRPVKYRVDWMTIDQIVQEDRGGSPIHNSAGQGFIDPLILPAALPVMVAQKNLSSLGFVLQLGLNFQNTTNKTAFFLAPPRQAIVESITAGDKQIENGVAFYPTTFRIQFHRSKVDERIVDQGFAYWDSADPATRKLITAKNDNALATEPVLLDTDGTRLADGTTGKFKSFRVRAEVDFRGLGI